MKKVINARMNVKSGKTELFLSLAKTIAEKSNAEPGCLMYKVYREVDNPSAFIFYEIYENQQAIDSHNASEHFKFFKEQMAEILTEKSLVDIF
jgi:quinol monooxygenase YgiN